MTKFNPTKIQRRMIRKIFHYLKAGKKEFKDYPVNGEIYARIEFGKARGIANFMLSEAKSARELIVAERIFNVAWDVRASRFSNLPCPVRIRLRNERITRHEQRKVRLASVLNHAEKVGV